MKGDMMEKESLAQRLLTDVHGQEPNRGKAHTSFAVQ